MFHNITQLSAEIFSVGNTWQNVAFYSIIFVTLFVVIVQLNPSTATAARRIFSHFSHKFSYKHFSSYHHTKHNHEPHQRKNKLMIPDDCCS
ncbi:hypothetical protein [Mucilaginibacter segetis]|uniref:Uncharacterized protein n=1 Tax=Mucilaginibacter segetis TaxID=2793071 RepID=A0A934PSZ4_9SPHI|nr:hypothetical protein [Mucilaginibacter segetis]MBK0378626.1 hypothetical protein [Mucilaginibacter segetis]